MGFLPYSRWFKAILWKLYNPMFSRKTGDVKFWFSFHFRSAQLSALNLKISCVLTEKMLCKNFQFIEINLCFKFLISLKFPKLVTEVNELHKISEEGCGNQAKIMFRLKTERQKQSKFKMSTKLEFQFTSSWKFKKSDWDSSD